ncbi:MAG TPA: SpoIID/LytB domain-containing protein, partial [Terriglobia bacterium]|nr:SpoIID/LytB domain-containing protein [Terriglobia bacterium]
EGVRCELGSTGKHFGRAFASSPSPFLLEAAPGASGEVHAAEIFAGGEGVRAVVTIGLETYVSGVLAGEGATLNSPAARQAMAVVARTWAVRSRGRHRGRGFDFCSLTHCQFFRLPSDMGDAARKTSGLVLKYQGQPIDAYYSAHCGGVTEAAGDVWPDRAAPYLRSVPDPYCARSPHSSWQRVIPLAKVETILGDKLRIALNGPLRNLSVVRTSASGRARSLRVEAGSSREIDANEFRYAVNRELGWNTLKSSLYTVEQRGNSLVFTGRGLGHGVGLCQVGAEQMGQMGIAYEKILAHYFPGTKVESVASPRRERILSSEHFELIFPPGQESWASETLQALETARRQLGRRVELLPDRVRVRTWETTEEFIRATGQPGWVAASSNGRVIELQPLRTLKQKGILHLTVRHELTHLAVHRLRDREVPRWYEEGLVLYLTGEQAGVSADSLDPSRSLEETITRPRSETEMKAAYARALALVRELARRRGEPALWQVLEHPTGEDVNWFRESERRRAR